MESYSSNNLKHIPNMPDPMEKEIAKGSPENGEDKNLAKLAVKEILDKIGFGFGSQQFINILLFQIGASLFLVGIINSLKVIFGNLASFFIEKFQKFKTKELIGLCGIIFGFSFLMIAVAVFLKSVVLFALALIIGSIALVIYGESKIFFGISSEKAYLVEKIVKYSLLITAVSLFIAAYLMDSYPAFGKPVLLRIYNNLISLKIYGYLAVFEIAAISFIVAGYILSKAGKKPAVAIAENLQLSSLFNLSSFFIKNKMVLLLTISSLIVGLVQTIGYSYYGIFIYQNFKNVLFGGFLNVAMVFLISVFTSLIGYFITKINARVYRKFPILIFGIIMLAFMPFTYFFNPNLILITIGAIIGAIGGSAIGVANSLLAIELISFNLRKAYFSFINAISIPFFLMMAPVLAYIVQAYGLSLLFLLLTIILSVLVVALLIASVIFKKELV